MKFKRTTVLYMEKSSMCYAGHLFMSDPNRISALKLL